MTSLGVLIVDNDFESFTFVFVFSFFFKYPELGRIVRVTYAECLGPLDQEVTTMDLLKRIELRMEFLTQNLERLPLEKVKIAQRVSDNGFPY